MDAVGDIPGGDVHIRDGQIVAVGRGLAAPGAEVIDAQDQIVAPGLVDTHWHMWNTLLRGLSDGVSPEGSVTPGGLTSGMGGSRPPSPLAPEDPPRLGGSASPIPPRPPIPPRGYFVTCVALGKHFLPGDTYAGTRLACAEAVDSGITTVHDW